MTSTTESTTANGQAGQPVQYFGAQQGGPFAAVILLTAEDWDEARAPEGARIPQPGEVTLEVTRPSGARYVRAYVPLQGSPAHLTALEDADPGEDGEPSVRFWRPLAT